MKRSPEFRAARIAILAALAIPAMALAQEPPPPTPPAAPPAQSETTTHVLQDAAGRDVTLRQHAPDSVVGDYQVDLDALDADGDGWVSRGEAQANPTLSAEFDGVDRDGDGRLGREELADWSR